MNARDWVTFRVVNGVRYIVYHIETSGIGGSTSYMTWMERADDRVHKKDVSRVNAKI